MKRLLGIISLVFCALLMSCSNGISDKTGDINFSFNVEDALRAASLDRATDGSENTANSEKEYIFLVQVKGSKNYYKCLPKAVKVQENGFQIINTTFSNNNNNNNTNYAEDCGTYVNENEAELTFTFDSVPTNQKYKVMFDMFQKVPVPQYDEEDEEEEPQTQYKFVNVLSGHSSDIQVLRGMQSPVEVDIDSFEYSPISLTVEYAEGGGSDNIPVKAISAPRENSNSPWSTITYNIIKKYGKLWLNKQGGDSATPIRPIQDIYYSLDPNSNYADSSYKYSVPYGINNDNGAIGHPFYNEFTFNGTSYSLDDFLMNYKFPESDVGTLNGTSETLLIDNQATISKDNFTFIENTPKFQYVSQDEVVSGSRQNVNLIFNRKQDNDDSSVYDLVSTEDIYQLLGLNQNDGELSGKTIALVLKKKANSPNPTNNQLYYKVDETEPDWDRDFFDYLLRSENHCINLKPGETKYIIPIEYDDETPKLTLFMDANENSPNSLSYTFDVDYYIFPVSMDPFIFNIKYNDNRYRYELDEYLQKYANFPLGETQSGCTFNTTLNGVFCLFSLADKRFVPVSMQLTSELWYWKPVDSTGQNYVTLSRQPQSFTTKTNFDLMMTQPLLMIETFILLLLMTFRI